jgi:hypothetical protein
MAMRITHMLIHYEDDGFWLMNYDDHMARDRDYAEFSDHFAICENCNPGGKGDDSDMPVSRIDLLVPFYATEKEIMEKIGEAIEQKARMDRMMEMVIAMVLR